MKKVIILLMVSSLFFISCSKKENNQTTEAKNQETKTEKEETFTEVKLEKKTKEYLFVNSVDGLRIRKEANVESEKIGSLKNKEKIEVISKGTTPVEIDGITSTWYEIKTDEGIQGFAFGGYLEYLLEHVEIIQEVEGDYWDEKNLNNVNIKYNGNRIMLVTTNIPIFPESQKSIEVYNILHTDLFAFAHDGKGGFCEEFRVKFNDNKELIFQDDRYEAINMFEENETHIETHKTTLFVKK